MSTQTLTTFSIEPEKGPLMESMLGNSTNRPDSPPTPNVTFGLDPQESMWEFEGKSSS